MTSRYLQIDVYRAYAVFGLFIVHCVELFELHWFDPQPTALFDFVFLLFAGKAFAMFALSFGVSFFIISERAGARGKPFELNYAWRLVLLIAIGLGHTALYRGDILVLLGLFGLLLIPLNWIGNRWVLGVIAAGFLVNVPLIARLIQSYNVDAASLGLMGTWNDLSMAAYMQGDIGATVAANLGVGNGNKWLFVLESGRVSQIIGLFVLGLILARAGFFTELKRFQLHRWLVILCGGISTLAFYKYESALVSIFPQNDFWGTGFYASNLVGGWKNLLFMMVQTSIIFELWYWTRGHGLKMFAAAGRMSLTLYVGQSVVLIPILYNFGLGLWDDVTMLQMVLVGVFGFAAQVICANLWFRYFNYGPLEWLWRAATQINWKLPIRIQSRMTA